MTKEAMDRIGETADSLDSLVAATQLPMPAQFHLDMLRAALPKLVQQLREAYVSATGENPWGTHP